MVGRGDGPAGFGGSDDNQSAGGTWDDAERDCPSVGRNGGSGAASPPTHGGWKRGREVVTAAAGGEPGRSNRALAVAAGRGWGEPGGVARLAAARAWL